MNIIKSIHALHDHSNGKNIGLTIGNFDGVHQGHQFLLKKVKKSCEKANLLFAVFTFVPHPFVILNKRPNNYLINSYKERRELLSRQGVDLLIECDFTPELAKLTPDKFLKDFIFADKIKRIFLGHDFSFGVNKSGDFSCVEKYEKEYDFKVEELPAFDLDNSTISSSRIRNLISTGKVSEANGCLSRDFFIPGIVVRGRGRGRQLGFPTANLFIDMARIMPEKGVYVTKTFCQGKSYFSVTNVGLNPTFKDKEQIHIETHILDFDKDIYGEEIEVSFIEKIRNETKFSSVDELVKQIKKDIKHTRSYLKND